MSENAPVAGKGDLVYVAVVAVADETALTAGTKKTFRLPVGMRLFAGEEGIRASVVTSSTLPAGDVVVDVNEDGTSILSTKITIAATETTSVDNATPPVISDVELADNARMTIDVDTPADAEGLQVTLRGLRTTK